MKELIQYLPIGIVFTNWMCFGCLGIMDADSNTTNWAIIIWFLTLPFIPIALYICGIPM